MKANENKADLLSGSHVLESKSSREVRQWFVAGFDSLDTPEQRDLDLEPISTKAYKTTRVQF